jgi:general stress protein YciG
MATTNQKNQTGSERQSNMNSQNRSNSGNNSGNVANMDDNKRREMANKGGKTSPSGGSSNRSH